MGTPTSVAPFSPVGRPVSVLSFAAGKGGGQGRGMGHGCGHPALRPGQPASAPSFAAKGGDGRDRGRGHSCGHPALRPERPASAPSFAVKEGDGRGRGRGQTAAARTGARTTRLSPIVCGKGDGGQNQGKGPRLQPPALGPGQLILAPIVCDKGRWRPRPEERGHGCSLPRWGQRDLYRPSPLALKEREAKTKGKGPRLQHPMPGPGRSALLTVRCPRSWQSLFFPNRRLSAPLAPQW